MNEQEAQPRSPASVAFDPAQNTIASGHTGAGTDTDSAGIYPSFVSPVSVRKPVTERETQTRPTIGKYLITALLGQGAQGEVYRAVHPGLGREVVIKLSRIPLSEGGSARDSLLTEGKLLAELDHPNLARVYDCDVHDGCPFLVMEYVRGCTLEQFAQQRQLTSRQAAALVARLARALAVAHRRGIVHQDIKPRNILIDEAGQPRLIDFGLASWHHGWADEPRSDSISGTPAYMAPEQARGENERVDQRSDLFALGGVLYHLLTGKPPFSGRNVRETLDRAGRCDWDKPALRTKVVSGGLRNICRHALAAEPANRYASAEAFAADLERFVRLPRTRLWLAAALVLALASAAIGWGVFHTPAAPLHWPSQYLITLTQRRVQGEDRFFDDLRNAIPLHTGDKLQIRCTLPRGLHPALFWFDTEGKLVELSAIVRPSGSVDQLVYPSEGVVPVDGPPGMEFVLVCASRSSTPRRADVEKLLKKIHSWPQLPAQALLLLNSDTVEIKGERGVGAQPETIAVSEVQESIEQLRQKLAEKFEFWVGVAFAHQD